MQPVHIYMPVSSSHILLTLVTHRILDENHLCSLPISVPCVVSWVEAYLLTTGMIPPEYLWASLDNANSHLSTACFIGKTPKIKICSKIVLSEPPIPKQITSGHMDDWLTSFMKGFSAQMRIEFLKSLTVSSKLQVRSHQRLLTRHSLSMLSYLLGHCHIWKSITIKLKRIAQQHRGGERGTSPLHKHMKRKSTE